MDRLSKTWGFLILLVGATVLLASFDGRLAAFGLLALAWIKARTILGGFLHLDAAPGWLAAFTLPLALWLAALWGLHSIALR